MELKNLLFVGFGGFLGSICRYITYILIDKRFHSVYPVSTFTVNIIGSLILGIITGMLIKSGLISDNMRLFLAVGFCGSFTTFSTFAYENLFFYHQKLPGIALLYIAASLLFGFFAVFLGYELGKSF